MELSELTGDERLALCFKSKAARPLFAQGLVDELYENLLHTLAHLFHTREGGDGSKQEAITVCIPHSFVDKYDWDTIASIVDAAKEKLARALAPPPAHRLYLESLRGLLTDHEDHLQLQLGASFDWAVMQ